MTPTCVSGSKTGTDREHQGAARTFVTDRWLTELQGRHALIHCSLPVATPRRRRPRRASPLKNAPCLCSGATQNGYLPIQIPSGPARRQGPAPQQDGGGTGDGGGRPLALGLRPQVSVHSLERGLHLPAAQEPGHDRVRVGAEQGHRRPDPIGARSSTQRRGTTG